MSLKGEWSKRLSGLKKAVYFILHELIFAISLCIAKYRARYLCSSGITVLITAPSGELVIIDTLVSDSGEDRPCEIANGGTLKHSTDTGGILSIGHKCKIDKEETKLFGFEFINKGRFSNGHAVGILTSNITEGVLTCFRCTGLVDGLIIYVKRHGAKIDCTVGNCVRGIHTELSFNSISITSGDIHPLFPLLKGVGGTQLSNTECTGTIGYRNTDFTFVSCLRACSGICEIILRPASLMKVMKAHAIIQIRIRRRIQKQIAETGNRIKNNKR